MSSLRSVGEVKAMPRPCEIRGGQEVDRREEVEGGEATNNNNINRI